MRTNWKKILGFRNMQEKLEKRIEAEGDKSITVRPLDFFQPSVASG